MSVHLYSVPMMDEELYGKPLLYRGMEGFDEQTGAVYTDILNRATNDLKEEYR